MIYAQLDVDFPHHARAISAGVSGRDLYTSGLCYAKKYLTDGHIPEEEIPHLSPGNPWRTSAAKLVKVGLWDKTETGYVIHDYGQRNPPAEVERSRIEASKSKKRRWWERNKTRPDARPSSGGSSDQILDGLVDGSTRAREALPSAVPPIVPRSSAEANGWHGKPSQDPARLPSCTVSPLWRNPHEYHVHGRGCRFP